VSTRKKNLVPLFGVAFIVAIISTGIFYGLFVGKLNSAPPAAAGGSILIATKAIPAGTVLTAQHLRTAPWGATPAPAGAITRLQDAVGKTVVEPVAENELLTSSQLASKNGGSVEGGSMGIPDGMRAVSLTVQDSAGVIALLKPGHRVDIQVVASIPGSLMNEPQLRTMLENMQVLTIPRDPHGSRGNAQVVTVLATPKEAAALGLADSTAKIRITLRNPMDQKTDNLMAVGLGSVLRQGANATTSFSPVAPRRPVATTQAQQVEFLLRVAGLGSEASKELELLMDSRSGNAGMLQVTALRPGVTDQAIARLQRSNGLELLTTSQVLASLRQEAGAHWTLDSKTSAYGLRVQLVPSLQADGKVRLRVHPEVSTAGENGIARRKVDTEIEVADGQSFLVRGFAEPAHVGTLRDQLFPGKANAATSSDLIVVVTPKVIRSAPAIAAVVPTV